MATKSKFVLLLLLCLAYEAKSDVSADDIEKYFMTALSKYPAWLQRNNMEPFHDVHWNTTMESSWFELSYNLELSDLTVINHSILDPHRTKVYVDMESQSITIAYRNTERDVFFSGLYNVSGNLSGATPYHSQGEWNVVANYSTLDMASMIAEYTITSFTITPDCWFTFSPEKSRSLVFMTPTSTFQNLDAGSEESTELLKQELDWALLSYLNRGIENPISNLMTTYLTHVIESQPICSQN